MQNDTSLIIDATRKASRFLQRDYCELENLQLSERGTEGFCKKSYSKALQTVTDALSGYSQYIITNIDDVPKGDISGKVLLVEVLGDMKNFERALPFFGIMVTVISQKNTVSGKFTPEVSVINFPAFGEIYYAERGKGAWVERHASNFTGATRVRVSGVNNIENVVTAIFDNRNNESYKNFQHIRMFDSYIYSLALLICGKIDAVIIPQALISSYGIELFTSEAGGQCADKNGLLLASNLKLHEKIKHVI